MKNKIFYLAMYDKDLFPGVDKKLRGFVDVASKLGYEARLENIWNGSGIKNRIHMIARIASIKNSNILIRWPAHGAYLLFPSLILAKLRNCTIIADIPTPRATVLLEIRNSNIPKKLKFLTLFKIIFDGAWVLWPTDKIINYAPEGAWFTFFNKKKSILIGNGIDVESIPIRVPPPNSNNKNINLIGVANVEDWHGYDRVIKGIHKHNSNPKKICEINFIIIGEGSVINKLKELTYNLNLSSQIIFKGQLNGEKLIQQYDSAHIGVGSLGLHRKGLIFASSLKDREYCAIGIPFIAAGIDPDFDDKFPWRFPAEISEEPLDFSLITNWFHSISPVNSGIMRSYAQNHCDYKSKISLIMNTEKSK